MKNKKNSRRYKKAFKEDDEDNLDVEIIENLDHPLLDDDYQDGDVDDSDDDEEEVKSSVDIKKTKKLDKAKFYVEPKKFDDEIMLYYSNGIISNELAEMISKISNKLSYAPNFINYSYREEMVGDGIIRMMKALIAKKYNHIKGTNPFSYFTRIAFNAFRNRIKKEKKIHETHEKYRRELMNMSENYNNLLKNNNIRIMKERDRFFE
jgi:hypothetical protein